MAGIGGGYIGTGGRGREGSDLFLEEMRSFRQLRSPGPGCTSVFAICNREGRCLGLVLVIGCVFSFSPWRGCFLWGKVVR